MSAEKRSRSISKGKERLGAAVHRSGAIGATSEDAATPSLIMVLQTLPPTIEDLPDFLDRPPEPVDPL